MGAIKTIRQSTPAELAWFCRGLSYAPHTDLKGLTGIDSKGDVVAIVGFDGWTYGSVCLHSWISRGALTRDFLREVARYPFSTGRQVLIGKTPANNEPALRFNKHYGFTEVHRIRDGFAPGVDLIIQELRHDQCRWYKHEYGNGTSLQRTKPTSNGCGHSERLADNGVSGAAPTAEPGTTSYGAGCATAAYGPVRRTSPDRSGSTGPGDGRSFCSNPGAESPGRHSASSGSTPSSSAAGISPSQSSSSRPSDSSAAGPHAEKRWYSTGLPNGLDENVSIEPRCDIEAQLEDLFRPGSKRRAVYLSPRNVAEHRDVWVGKGLLAYYIPNDGILLFRNGSDCTQFENRFPREPIRKLIGELVMAGQGKPEYSADACVVQHLSESGSVDRESLQPSEQAARGILRDWSDCVSGTSRIISPLQALERRQALVAGGS